MRKNLFILKLLIDKTAPRKVATECLGKLFDSILKIEGYSFRSGKRQFS